MLIIDCNNLWYAAMVLAEPLSGIARHELVRLLEDYSHRAGEPMTIVLDGHPSAAAGGQAGSQRIYAGSRPADDVIIDYVERSSEPRRLTVVSSDRSLIREVRKRRARVIESAVFAARLARWAARPVRRRQSEPAAKETGLGGSRHSLGEWLKFFQLSPEKSDIIGGERAGTREGGQTQRSTSHSSSSPDVQETAVDASDSQMRRVFDDVKPLKRRRQRRPAPRSRRAP